ncbi:MAG: hypothetical protein KIT09_35830 [Bryobacteraceae bacterium]|nr:hypothetical protein [Bryobacteraceae bacterium]
MAAGKTTHARNAVVNATLRGIPFTPPAALWLALHYADPTEAGSQNELSGAGYARQPIAFGAPSPAGTVANSAEILFPTATTDWLVVTHWSLWDAVSGGNAWYQAPLAGPVQIEQGDDPKVLAGALVVAEQ